MSTKLLRAFMAAWAVLLPLSVSSFAQTAAPSDKLTYVLVSADLRARAPFDGQLLIEFGKSFPQEYIDAADDTSIAGGIRFSVPIQPRGEWLVQSIRIKESALPGSGTSEMIGVASFLKPVSVRVAGAPENKLLLLDMGNLDALVSNSRTTTLRERLNPATHKITIIYRQANFPSVVLAAPQKKGAAKAFTAAKGKSDADIYFSGTATAARGSGPLYSIEAKARYLFSLRRYGAIGAGGTFVSDEGSDVDPDSITVAGSYEKVFVFAPANGVIVRSDFLGGEFDKKKSTKNLTTGLEATLVLPSAQFGETNFAGIDFLGGFEGGKNYKSVPDPDGIGGFWRWKGGANAYLVALRPPFFNRITFDTEYRLRLPRQAEPFTEKIEGEKVTTLTKKPRHYVGSDLNLLFSPAYGLSLKYRYGSLPPAFSFVNHKVSLGFTLQVKQANK